MIFMSFNCVLHIAMTVILISTKLAVERGLFPKADYSTVLQLSDKIIRAMIESLLMVM